jgi:hypothetical protein
MLCAGYGEAKASGWRVVLHRPLIRHGLRPLHLLPQGEKEKNGAPYLPFAILLQCCSAASIRFSLASGVRNAECADSVTFGNFVSS